MVTEPEFWLRALTWVKNREWLGNSQLLKAWNSPAENHYPPYLTTSSIFKIPYFATMEFPFIRLILFRQFGSLHMVLLSGLGIRSRLKCSAINQSIGWHVTAVQSGTVVPKYIGIKRLLVKPYGILRSTISSRCNLEWSVKSQSGRQLDNEESMKESG
jgi:hypothetical protein